MNKLLLGIIPLLILMTGTAYSEEYTVELSTDDGFTPQYLNATHNDKVTFIIRDGEAHDISNPWKGGHNFLNQDNPSITHTFDTCNTYKFDSTFYIDEIFTLDVVNCPIPEVVQNIPEVIAIIPEEPQLVETSEGFTGWQQEGDRMVAYRLGVEVDSFVINEMPYSAQTQAEKRPDPNIDTNSFDFSEDAGILSLRLQIMQVLESILKILFSR